MAINPVNTREPVLNQDKIWGRFNCLYDDQSIPVTFRSWPVREGYVTSVNYDDYTCNVMSYGAMYERVRCVSPWFSFSHGHGINFCPESNSWVLMSKGPLRTDPWFIVGFIPIEQLKESMDESDSYYRNNKPEMTEGDIHISTDSGNFIFIQKSAHAIRLENTPACFIDMQSSNNYIHIGCQNILLQTKAGMITMRAESPELIENEEGKTKAKPVDVCTTGFFRSNTSDYENFLKIDVGKVKLNNPDVPDNTILALNICNKVGIIIDTDGNIKTYTSGKRTIMSDGDTTIASKSSVCFKSGSSIKIDASNDIISNSGNSITEQSGVIINSAGKIEHSVGSGSPETSAPYPSIPDNRNNVQNCPFVIKHLI